MDQKVLITGRNGFVAKHLKCDLEKRGCFVYTTSRSGSSHDDNNYIVGALEKAPEWGQAVQGKDVVVHLAARVHHMEDKPWDKESLYMRCNYDATKTLFEAAEKAEVKTFIFLSTIFVNGNSTPVDQPFTEASPVNPQNNYALSKLRAEEFLKEKAKETSMRIVILRPPMIYGPGAKGNFESLVKLCKTKLPLPLKNFDKNKRNFLFVGNLTSYIMKCIEDESFKGLYLVADKEAVSTYDFARQIRNALGNRAPIFRFPGLRVLLTLLGMKKHFEKLNSSLFISMNNNFNLRFCINTSIQHSLKSC